MSDDINVQSFSGKVNISNNLKVGAGHLFVDTINNMVGLNTSTPESNLHVNGNVHVETDISLGGILSGNGSGLTNVNSDSGSWINGANSNIHLAVSTDKVGIGTVDPSHGLVIRKNTDTLLLESENAGATYPVNIDFKNYDAQDPIGARISVIDDAAYGSHLTFHTKEQDGNDATSAITEKVRIQSNGNVGVGTVLPSGTLDVSSTRTGLSGLTTNEATLMISCTDPNAADEGDIGGGVVFRQRWLNSSTSLVPTGGIYGYKDRNSGSYGGGLLFTYCPNNGTGGVLTEAMRITKEGNVGIGASVPDRLLHVETPIGTSENYIKIVSGMNNGSAQSISGIEFKTNPQFYNGDNSQRVPAQIRSGFYNGPAGTANWGDAYISLLSTASTSSGALTEHVTCRGGRVGIMTTTPGATLDVHGTDTSPIKKTAPSAATNSYNFVLNGPRPGTTSSGATHFINGSTRNDDGGASTYTIRNDSGQLRLGHSSYTTIFDGNHLRMNQGDNSFFHFGPNGTWSGELYVGATSNRSTSALRAQCISTNGNLHLDAGNTRNTYINYYSGSAVVLKHYIVSGRPLAVAGKNNLGSAGQGSGVFIFNTALINSGIYNTSNGRFTIPSDYPGYYLVAFVGLGAYYNTNAPNTRWYHNGSVHSYGAYHTNLSGMSGTPAHVGVSGSHVLYLGAGDYIDLRIVGGTLYGQSTLHAYATVMYLGA